MIRKESVTNDILEVLKTAQNKQAGRAIITRTLAPFYSFETINEGFRVLKEKGFIEEVVQGIGTDPELKIPDNQREIAKQSLKEYFKKIG